MDDAHEKGHAHACRPTAGCHSPRIRCCAAMAATYSKVAHVRPEQLVPVLHHQHTQPYSRRTCEQDVPMCETESRMCASLTGGRRTTTCASSRASAYSTGKWALSLDYLPPVLPGKMIPRVCKGLPCAVNPVSPYDEG